MYYDPDLTAEDINYLSDNNHFVLHFPNQKIEFDIPVYTVPYKVYQGLCKISCVWLFLPNSVSLIDPTARGLKKAWFSKSL